MEPESGMILYFHARLHMTRFNLESWKDKNLHQHLSSEMS